MSLFSKSPDPSFRNAAPPGRPEAISTAEDYHQQYLAKNPNGYCPVHATGASCPIGVATL